MFHSSTVTINVKIKIKRMKENNAALQHQNAQLAQEKKDAENEV